MVPHPTRQPALALALIAICAAAVLAETRVWTDSTGKFSVEAELVEIRQDAVVLRRISGATVTVPRARLSDADHRYLRTVETPAWNLSEGAGQQAPLAYPDALTSPPPWNDATPPFDLAAFLQAPPVAENAAPLYLEALLEFDKLGMVETLFPEMPEHERKQWWLAARTLSQEKQRLEEAWERDPQSVDYEAVDTWLAKYDVGFEKLAAAQRRPECVFQTGRSFDSFAAHVVAARDVSHVIQWRVRRDLQDGDLQRPLADLKVLLRLTRDLRPRSQSAWFTSTFLEEIACRKLVPAILTAPEITVQDCDHVLALLIEHERNAIDMLHEGICADYFVARQTLHDLQHRLGAFDPHRMKETWDLEGEVQSWVACIEVFANLGMGDVEALRASDAVSRLERKLLPTAATGGKLLADEDYADDVRMLNDYYATLLTWADSPDTRRRLEERRAPIELYKPLRDALLTRIVAGFLGAPNNPRPQSESFVRGAQCLAALRRWQLEHTDVPPDLETAIKAAGMPGVPMDPFSAQPLRMVVIEDEPVIYAVGPDLQDDIAQRRGEFSPEQRREDDDVFFVLRDGFLTHSDTVAQIEKLGGRCTVDEYGLGKPVVRVEFGGARSTDETLKLLGPLRQLQSLSLMGAQVTDTGLKELTGLMRLRWLNLANTQVTDIGLKQLTGLMQLQTLNLGNTKVTDAGAQELQKALPKARIMR